MEGWYHYSWGCDSEPSPPPFVLSLTYIPATQTIGLFVAQTASTRRRALAEARTKTRTPWPEVDKIARQQREEQSLTAIDADTKR